MASPQTENGYTRIANEILEKIINKQLNATQLKIILTVWRYTYGFNRKQHMLSETFISKATGISKRYISSEINKLIQMNLLKVIKVSTFNTARVISFNKNYDEWSVTKRHQLNNSSTVEQTISTTVEELFITPVEQFFHQERNIKDNIKEREIEGRSAIISQINDKCFEYTGDFITPEFKYDCEVRLSENTEPEIILKALSIAGTKARANKCGYAIKILQGWAREGIRTIYDYEIAYEKPKQRTKHEAKELPFDEDEIIRQCEEEIHGRKTS